jgi:hypothetical protein
VRSLVVAFALLVASRAHADVSAIVPATDVRKATLVGTNGEIYAGDGKGTFIRTQQGGVAATVTAAGVSGGAAVVLAGGVVYKHADNGWSAIRLAQKTRAVMSGGSRAVAAVGRQIVALDQDVKGEAVKLASASSAVLKLGAGKAIVFQTDSGLFRVDGKKVKPLKGFPRQVTAIINDKWATVDKGAVSLDSGRVTTWPADVTVTATGATAKDGLAAVGSVRGGGFALLVVSGTKIDRTTITGLADGKPIAVSIDADGRALVALADGRFALRTGTTWSLASVTDAVPAPRPGSPPAVSQQ